MILVKGPEEALRLIEELPEVTEINYGGVAKNQIPNNMEKQFS